MAIPQPGTKEVQSTPAGLSYEAFLEWLDEDTRAEWVNGEIIVVSPASDPHQDLSDFLTTVLRTFLEEKGLGIVRSAPFQMNLNVAWLWQDPLPRILDVLRELNLID